MWLNLEAGSARALRHQGHVLIPSPPTGARWSGRRALTVEAAHTLLPEAAVECLPELARDEIEAGLGGRLRNRIAEAATTDPALPRLRDELVTELSGTAGTTGAPRLLDRIYTGRLVRRVVPAIITASCLGWYRHWRSTNGGPSLDLADVMDQAVQLWLSQPGSRRAVDARIAATARHHAGNRTTALEDTPV